MNRILIALLFAAAACGGKAKPTTSSSAGGVSDPPGVVQDTRSPIEQRRDTVCEALGPKITKCAVADARAELEAGKMTKQDFDLNTAPAIQTKNTEEFVQHCEVQLSSRQVRVLEVCSQQETECAPLLACLDHINDQATGSGAGSQ